MTYKVIFAYPVEDPPKVLPNFVKGPLVIEQTIPYENIDKEHMIGVKRALLYIAPESYHLVEDADDEFREYFQNKGKMMKKIMFRTKTKPKINIKDYPGCVYILATQASK